MSSKFFRIFLAEVFINLIFPYPVVDSQFTFKLLGKSIIYRGQTFLYSFNFLKIYHIYKLFGVYSTYNSLLAEKYCDSSGFHASYMFAIKCDLKEKPFNILIFTLINVGLVLGILVRFFEAMDIESREDFAGFANGIWLIFIALTTVGYGDLYPVTHFGRLIVIIGVFVGTFIISITIVSFSNMSNFDNHEYKSFMILNRYLLRNQLQDVSRKMISNFIGRIRCLKQQSKIKDIPGLEKDYKNLQNKFYEFNREKSQFIKIFADLSRRFKKEFFKDEDAKFLDIESEIGSSINFIQYLLRDIEGYSNILELQLEKQHKLMQEQNKFFSIIEEMKSKFNKLSISLLNSKSKCLNVGETNHKDKYGLKLTQNIINEDDNEQLVTPSTNIVKSSLFNNLNHYKIYNVKEALAESNDMLMGNKSDFDLKSTLAIHNNKSNLKKINTLIDEEKVMDKIKDDPFSEDAGIFFDRYIKNKKIEKESFDKIFEARIQKKVAHRESNLSSYYTKLKEEDLKKLKENSQVTFDLYNEVQNRFEENFKKKKNSYLSK